MTMKHLFLVLLLATSLVACKGSNSNRTTAHLATIPQGELQCVQMPKGTPDVEVNYDVLRIHFNPKLRIPSAVAYRLTATMVAQSDAPNAEKRDNYKFNADPDVKNCPEWYDYKNSGYDRGHMAPAMDMRGNKRIMTQCFLMTNIVPQNRSLNAGEWKEMEESIHRLAKARKEVYIVSGPVMTGNYTCIGEKQDIAVPPQLFKLVYVPSLGKGVAFLFDNTGTGISWKKHAVTIRQIEQLTGINFFPTLPQAQQDAIETSADISWWTGGNKSKNGSAKDGSGRHRATSKDINKMLRKSQKKNKKKYNR